MMARGGHVRHNSPCRSAVIEGIANTFGVIDSADEWPRRELAKTLWQRVIQ